MKRIAIRQEQVIQPDSTLIKLRTTTKEDRNMNKYNSSPLSIKNYGNSFKGGREKLIALNFTPSTVSGPSLVQLSATREVDNCIPLGYSNFCFLFLFFEFVCAQN